MLSELFVIPNTVLDSSDFLKALTAYRPFFCFQDPLTSKPFLHVWASDFSLLGNRT